MHPARLGRTTRDACNLVYKVPSAAPHPRYRKDPQSLSTVTDLGPSVELAILPQEMHRYFGLRHPYLTVDVNNALSILFIEGM